MPEVYVVRFVFGKQIEVLSCRTNLSVFVQFLPAYKNTCIFNEQGVQRPRQPISSSNPHGSVIVSTEQASIAYRIAKCCSRCGDKSGATAGMEQLLYHHSFWEVRYRFVGAFALSVGETS